MTHYEVGDVRAKMSISDRNTRIALADAFRNLERSGATLAQIALRFVLDQPAFATTVVGIKTPQQALENFSSVDMLPFAKLVQDSGL